MAGKNPAEEGRVHVSPKDTSFKAGAEAGTKFGTPEIHPLLSPIAIFVARARVMMLAQEVHGGAVDAKIVFTGSSLPPVGVGDLGPEARTTYDRQIKNIKEKK